MATQTLRSFVALAATSAALLLGAPGTQAASVQITNFEAAQADQLTPGTDLNFRVRGTPGARATVSVAGIAQPIRLRETAPGIYEGGYTIKRADRLAANPLVRANLRRGNVTTAARLGTPLAAVPSPAPAAAVIERFYMEPPSFEPGTELMFTVRGTPGGRASVNVNNATRVRMREVEPGVYQGRYTVRRQDNLNASSIGATLQAGGVNVRAALAGVAPQPAAAANYPLEILAPRSLAEVGNGPVEVRGRTAPNATLNANVNAVMSFIGPLGFNQNVFSRTIRADRNGNFAFTFQPKSDMPNAQYEIVIDGQVAGEQKRANLTLSQR